MLVTWCSDGGGEVDFHARVAAAWDTWAEAAPCADWSHEDRGDCASAAEVGLSFTYGDPADELEAGVLVVAYSGRVVFNDVAWSSDAEVAAGTCVERANLDQVLRATVGANGLGLGFACDIDACTAEEEAAVVSNTQAYCDDRLPNVADVALLRSVYGPVDIRPYADVVVGIAPVSACVSLPAVTADAEALATVTWNFGDGETATGLETCHTWPDTGSWPVTATVAYTCGGADVIDPYAVVTVLAPDAGEPVADEAGCAVVGWSGGIAGLVALGLVVGRRGRK